MTDFPLVMVEWEDSSQPMPSWQFKSDINVSTVRIASVGWLLRRDAQMVALAPNVGGLGDEEPQCSGVITIPSRAVLSLNLLNGEATTTPRWAPHGNTIQGCLLKALSEAPGGMHIADLVEAIYPIYGRRVSRVSVSPQLSRLKFRGLVTYCDGLWFAASGMEARQGGDGTAPSRSDDSPAPQSGETPNA